MPENDEQDSGLFTIDQAEGFGSDLADRFGGGLAIKIAAGHGLVAVGALLDEYASDQIMDLDG